MLTESEKHWLASRGKNPYCKHCSWDDRYCLFNRSCPLTVVDYRDAAEFEARVGIRASLYGFMMSRHPEWTTWGVLKFARLAVEESMDSNLSA